MCMSARPEKQPIYSHIYAATVFILVYGSTFLTTLVLYVKILQQLIRRKHISPDQLIEEPQNEVRTSGSLSQVRKKPVAPNICTEAIQKTFRMLSCSVLSYTICYSLYFYINLYYIYYGLAEKSGIALILIANWFGAVNSLINPIVYTVFVDQFRSVFGNMLTGKYLRRKTSSRFLNEAANRRGAETRRMSVAKSNRQKSNLSTISDLNSTSNRP